VRAGGLVGMPTETVYGLAANALDAGAVAKVFSAKGRPTFDPLIVHLADVSDLSRVVSIVPALAWRLAESCWPGPLTLVLPKAATVPDLVTSGLPGVGIRIPAHAMAQQLLREAGCPLAAPSANPFGGISPTTAAHVVAGLGGRVEYVLDGGPCRVGVESTVVSLMGEVPVVLRPGGVGPERLEELLGHYETARSDAALDDSAQPAPGMLSRHYAPRTPLRLIAATGVAVPVPGRRSGLLTWGSESEIPGFDRIFRLCSEGNPEICAAGFFAALRDLDSAGLDVIIARQFREIGLGVALNDRLRRGAAGGEK
jgi:L-threonylcarbamoyladenylate synthase